MTSERKCREWDIMPDCSIVPGWVRSYRAGLGRARCAYPVHFRQHSAADWFPVRAEPSFGCCCWGHLDSWKEKKKKWRTSIRWNPSFPSRVWTTRRWLCPQWTSIDLDNSASSNKCKPSGGPNPGSPAAAGVYLLLCLQQVRAATAPKL